MGVNLKDFASHFMHVVVGTGGDLRPELVPGQGGCAYSTIETSRSMTSTLSTVRGGQRYHSVQVVLIYKMRQIPVLNPTILAPLHKCTRSRIYPTQSCPFVDLRRTPTSFINPKLRLRRSRNTRLPHTASPHYTFLADPMFWNLDHFGFHGYKG